MSGHSKWHNIKNTKGAADAKRSTTFSKISKDIIVSVQVGGSGDPSFNPMLKLAINKAKAVNMPNDKIEKAISRGLGNVGTDDNFEDKTYEAYGPGGVSIIIDCHTDNPNRTLSDLKVIVTRNGGKMLSEGSISWRFKEVGRIVFSFNDLNTSDLETKLILPIMELDGVEDILASTSNVNKMLTIITNKAKLNDMHIMAKSKFADFIVIEEANIVKISSDKISINEEDTRRLKELIEKIVEIQDVENVFTNAG